MLERRLTRQQDPLAKLYFERVYGIWSPTKFKDALLGVVSAEGLDTLLIDYLGADDTPYVRAVTRKTLVAAVARIYRPGVKFDSILVLNGAQGIGKSTLFARLGGQWYSDSLAISDMKDKTAPEKLKATNGKVWCPNISILCCRKAGTAWTYMHAGVF